MADAGQIDGKNVQHRLLFSELFKGQCHSFIEIIMVLSIVFRQSLLSAELRGAGERVSVKDIIIILSEDIGLF